MFPPFKTPLVNFTGLKILEYFESVFNVNCIHQILTIIIFFDLILIIKIFSLRFRHSKHFQFFHTFYSNNKKISDFGYQNFFCSDSNSQNIFCSVLQKKIAQILTIEIFLHKIRQYLFSFAIFAQI